MSSKPLHEHDSDSSSDEEIGDRNTTQRNEDSVQQNSIDGITEESQAWLSKPVFNIIKTNENYNQRQKSQELPISRNFTTIGNADIHVQLAHVLQLLPLPFYTIQYYILSSIDNVSSFWYEITKVNT